MGSELTVTVRSVEEARAPEVIAWCLDRKSEGHSLQEIRLMVGLGDVSNDDWRWRVLRRALQRAERPDDEGDALLDFYTDIDDQIELLEIHLKELQKEIEHGDQTDKNYHFYFKYKEDTIRQITELKEKRFTGLIKKKELKSGAGKYAGAKITIIHNVPRPDDE